MRKLQTVFALMVVTGLLVSTSYGQAGFTEATSPSTPGVATLVYHPGTGNYTVNGGGEGGMKLSTWEHKDTGGLFMCDEITEGALPGLFDVCSGDKLFKLDPAGWGDEEFDFGDIFPKGLSFADINGVGAIGGSVLPAGGLDANVASSPHLFIVPEPSSFALIGVGLLGLLGIRRKRS